MGTCGAQSGRRHRGAGSGGSIAAAPPQAERHAVAGDRPVVADSEALQALGTGDTIERALDDPAGVGVAWMVQLVPFHGSASVPPMLPELSVENPAVQAEGDVHETEPSPLPPLAGFGVGMMLHREPSHRSASVPEFDCPVAI